MLRLKPSHMLTFTLLDDGHLLATTDRGHRSIIPPDEAVKLATFILMHVRHPGDTSRPAGNSDAPTQTGGGHNIILDK